MREAANEFQKISQPSRQRSRSRRTTRGATRFPLVPDSYKLTVSAEKLGTQEQQALTLVVGENVEENFVLSPATVVQQEAVTTALPVVDLASSQISNVMDEQVVRQLPLNTRDWSSLATLQPGVNQVRTEKAVAVGADRGNRGFGAQLTIAGGRPKRNNYRMESDEASIPRGVS